MQSDQEPLHTRIQPTGLERGAALSNILKGYEDFTLDIHGKIISSNLEAVNITGYEEWEAIGRNFSIFYTQQDKESGLPQKDLEKAKQDSRITFSAWRVKKRNVAFWAQITFICLKEDDGFVTGYKMILKDQTHRLISRKREKRFRDEYLNLFNNPFIGIFKFKITDFKFLLLNEKAGKIFGIEKTKKKFNEIFLVKDEFDLFIKKITDERKVQGFEFQVNTKIVEWVRIDCQLFETSGFAEGVITDITEKKKQFVQLQRLNDELDSFIYHASHDLRSPLATMIGLINLVEIDKQIDLKKYCNMMKERVTYLDELLKDIATIAYNNKSEIVIEQLDFKYTIEKCIEVYKAIHPNINIAYSVKLDSEFYSDQHRIQAIIKNLIQNAINHHNPRAGHSYLNIAVEANQKGVLILFADNGRGIKDEQLEQIFEMFYKSGNEVKENGLGLYITKLLVDTLKGYIGVKSKVGVGTKFEIELPNLKDRNNSSIKNHSSLEETLVAFDYAPSVPNTQNT